MFQLLLLLLAVTCQQKEMDGRTDGGDCMASR